MAVLGLGGFFIHQFAKANRELGETDILYNQALEVVDDQKFSTKNKGELRRISDTDLIRRYCASSVWEDDADECLRTVKIFEQIYPN